MFCKPLLISTLLSLGVFVQGCAQEHKPREKTSAPEGFSLSADSHFQVKADWDLPLKSGGEGTNEVVLTFLTRNEAAPQSVTLQEFHPRMPFMGNHGTDEETQAFVAGDLPGSIKVTGIYFNMPGAPGEWVVTLTAVVDGFVDEIKIPVPEVL